jgi:cobalamin biosynthesis protein CobT
MEVNGDSEQENQEVSSAASNHEPPITVNQEQENQQEAQQISDLTLIDDTDEEANGDSPNRTRRRRTQRDFPAAPFQEALELALAIQKHASGQKIRRLTLFGLMGRSAESGTSRQLVTNSNTAFCRTNWYSNSSEQSSFAIPYLNRD